MTVDRSRLVWAMGWAVLLMAAVLWAPDAWAQITSGAPPTAGLGQAGNRIKQIATWGAILAVFVGLCLAGAEFVFGQGAMGRAAGRLLGGVLGAFIILGAGELLSMVGATA